MEKEDEFFSKQDVDSENKSAIEEIKKCKDFENITDDEAEKIVLKLKEFSFLCYYNFERMKKNN